MYATFAGRAGVMDAGRGHQSRLRPEYDQDGAGRRGRRQRLEASVGGVVFDGDLHARCVPRDRAVVDAGSALSRGSERGVQVAAPVNQRLALPTYRLSRKPLNPAGVFASLLLTADNRSSASTGSPTVRSLRIAKEELVGCRRTLRGEIVPHDPDHGLVRCTTVRDRPVAPEDEPILAEEFP